MTFEIQVSCYVPNPLNANSRGHWSLFVNAKGEEQGTIYEATGGKLQMKYHEKANVVLTKSTTFKQSIVIGHIESGQLKSFTDIVKEVPLPASPMRLPPGERRRDCQDWVRDAVDALVAKGLLETDAASKLDDI